MTREARHLKRCSICREAGPLADHLRGLRAPALTASEQARLWQGIRAGIDSRRTWWLPSLVSWLRGLGRRRRMLAWAPALAAAILLLLAPFHLWREERVLSQAELNAQTAVQRVEAGLATSVFILNTATERLSIIWVTEPPRVGDAMHTPRG